MTRADIDAVALVNGIDRAANIPALLAYIEELERAVENEQLTFASCNRARIHCENECDSLHARINEMTRERDEARAQLAAALEAAP